MAVAALAAGLASARPGAAQGLAAADAWRYRTGSGVAIDGGLAAATPAALATGLGTGPGAGITIGDRLTWGARLAWTRATESAIDWSVRHDDLAVRVTAGAQAVIGRGGFGVQLGLGPTLVHELRVRRHGDIAGAMGSAREITGDSIGFAGELDAVVRLHVTGGWLLVIAGGPSLSRVEGSVRTGFATRIGVAWQL